MTEEDEQGIIMNFFQWGKHLAVDRPKSRPLLFEPLPEEEREEIGAESDYFDDSREDEKEKKIEEGEVYPDYPCYKMMCDEIERDLKEAEDRKTAREAAKKKREEIRRERVEDEEKKNRRGGGRNERGRSKSRAISTMGGRGTPRQAKSRV